MKQKRYLTVLLAVMVAIAMLPVAAFASDPVPTGDWVDYAAETFAGGSGTQEDPYLIETEEQLAKLSKDVAEGTSYGDCFFRLESDLDLSAHRWNPIGVSIWYLDDRFTQSSFGGSFDGGNHVITGLYVDERESKNVAGLFGNINVYTAKSNLLTIENLVIEDAVVYSSEEGLELSNSGILAGAVTANPGQQAVVQNITVSGQVINTATNGNNKSGGVVGEATRATFVDCHGDGVSVSGASNSGGFVGQSNSSVFERCTVTGTVEGLWALGGFVGYTTCTGMEPLPGEEHSFQFCSADVDVTGNDWQLGGFVGYGEYGSFETCVAYGDVTSTATDFEPRVGGFAGNLEGAQASDCFACGKVTGAHPTIAAGGFLGYDGGGSTTGCAFDNTVNPDLEGIGAVGTAGVHEIAGQSTEDISATICQDYYGGHDYSLDWTVDQEPTCTQAGSKSHHCTRCGAMTDVTEIDPLGHSAVKVEAKAATCTQDGNDAHWYCEVCGAYFSDEGLTQVITKDQTVVKATGHSYVDGVCTMCGEADPNYSTSPETGDLSSLGLCLALLMLSGAGALGVTVYSRKRTARK